MSNQFTGKELYRIAISSIATHESDECLIWEHGVNNRGYGRIQFEGKRLLLHRFAFKQKYGRYPKPCGLHSCDVRRCYNYRHVIEGSKYENNQHRMQRGRSKPCKGINHGRAKLHDSDVKQIRLLGRSITSKRLAELFEVSNSTIESIIKRKTWKHLK